MFAAKSRKLEIALRSPLFQEHFDVSVLDRALDAFEEGFPHGEVMNQNQIYTMEIKITRRVSKALTALGTVDFRGNKGELLRSLAGRFEIEVVQHHLFGYSEDMNFFQMDLFLMFRNGSWLLKTKSEMESCAI